MIADGDPAAGDVVPGDVGPRDPGPGDPEPRDPGARELAQHNPDKLRIRYSKVGKIRFTSQRDVARLWERALRRSGLPVAWSEGFSPRPLLSFGLALPTGAESLGEYLDVRLDPGGLPGDPPPDGYGDDPGPAVGLGTGGEPTAPVAVATGDDLRRRVLDRLAAGGRDLPALLTPLLPEGIAVQASALVPHATGSLQQEVSSCNWKMEVYGVAPRELTARVERLLDASSVVVRRERKGRAVEDDLRPGIRTLTVVADGTGSSAGGGTTCQLRAELATRPRGVRPGELLEGLGAGLALARACRTHQWIERDGRRWEPLGMGGERPEAADPRVRERAS